MGGFLLGLFFLGLAYLAGAVPFGLVIARLAKGIDPRTAGSGNIGATNVARLCGFGWGVATLLLDALKGFLPVLLASGVSSRPWFTALAALAAIAGHMFPVFLGFKGGKGVATTIGASLAMAPWATVISGLACLAAIMVSGFVSVGSLLFAGSLPFTLAFTGKGAMVPVGLLIAALIVWKHRENIRRLRAGEEKPWRKKPS